MKTHTYQVFILIMLLYVLLLIDKLVIWNSFKFIAAATWEASLALECLAPRWSCTAWRSCCPTRTRPSATLSRRACRQTPCGCSAWSSRQTWWRAWSECLVSPCSLAHSQRLKDSIHGDHGKWKMDWVNEGRAAPTWRLRQVLFIAETDLQVLAIALAPALFDCKHTARSIIKGRQQCSPRSL